MNLESGKLVSYMFGDMARMSLPGNRKFSDYERVVAFCCLRMP